MKQCVLSFVYLVLAFNVHAQTLSLSTAQLNFGARQTNTTDSLSFVIRNSGNAPVNVTDINVFKSAFAVRDTAFIVRAHDSVGVKVFFQTNQNVTWSDILVVENTGGRGSLTLRLTGPGTYNDEGYASTQNLWENALKTALAALVNNHTNLGYNTARDRMFETIDDGGVDTIECVYTGRKVYATTRTAAQNQNFNTEHTWPQSFFNEAEPMRADLNHLFPTDVDANSRRANYPFGPVSGTPTWQVGGSKLGTRSTGELVFEPRNSHKGDVARGLFYFVLRYGNLGSFLGATQEGDLRGWCRTDPVSTKETLRNNAIALAANQNKRNPLIDHPEFTDRITAFYTTSAPTLYADIVASPATASLGSVSYLDSVVYKLMIVNRGRATLTISSVTLQSGTTGYSILSYPTSIPADTFGTVSVKFKPTLPVLDAYVDNITINTNDPDQPNVVVPLSASAFLPYVDVHLMLEGPYQPATGAMATSLRMSGALVARYAGATIPSNAVDSINIELRDSLAASSSTIKSFRPAWLLANGFARSFTDTSSVVKFDDVPSGSYYIVVRHGNHLAVMSSQRYSLSSMPSSAYEFANSSTSAYGASAMKEVAGGVFALYAGDANQSGVVSAADANLVFGQLNVIGYSLFDANLSGVVTAADANAVFGNLNQASQVP